MPAKMQRNFTDLPDDENGDILWNMNQGGDNLSTGREIDFSVIFPMGDAALKFAMHVLRNQQKISFSSYEGIDDFPWQVQLHRIMMPRHGNVSRDENAIADDAPPLGGCNDGWGCFSQV